jgi:L,D-peptidoglycan transpeptidase YkuD (ErfK/YbiS/YcfS/YnhG family)
MSRPLRGLALGVGALLLAACGGAPTAAPLSSTSLPTTTTATTATTTATTSTTAARHTTRAAPVPTAKPTPRPARKTSTGLKPSPTAAGCRVPAGVTAPQVVTVTSSGSSATVRACRRAGSGYLLELGPYAGHVGRNGVSAAKREGDLRTPAGVFPLRGGFGAQPDPGLRLGWFQVDSRDVWVDDAGSSLYNTHQRTPVEGRWDSAEALLNTPAYSYAQVIGYNEERTPGRGSAIFLHVDTGGGTAGCVSLPTGALLAVLRWERPGVVMSIR